MPSYDVGELIRRLRKQKNMNQEELAYPIIDRATLSKIETGKVTPHRKTLEYLFDRLGFDSNEYISHFLTTGDVEMQLVVDEVSNLLKNVSRAEKGIVKNAKCERVEFLIKQLEENQEFATHPLNRQLILDVKARHAFNQKEDEKAAALCIEALEIEIPNYSNDNIAFYHLSRRCNNILNLLAMILSEVKNYEEAITILYGLKSNVDQTFKEIGIHAKHVSAVIRNLAMILLLADNPEDAWEICEEGIIICCKANEYLHYNAICWFQAKALMALGKTEEFIELSRKVYYSFDLFRVENHKDFVRDTVLAETGVDIAGLPPKCE